MPRKENYKTRDQLIQENKKLLEQIDLMQAKIDKLLEKGSESKQVAEDSRRLHFKLGTQSRSS